MKKLLPLLVAFILTVNLPVTGQNRISSFNLEKGNKMHSKIASGEKQRHKIQLEEDQFAFLKLTQEGINVKITIYGPDNTKIKEFNRTNGKNGIEPIDLSSSTKGEYTIEITALDKEGDEGSYKINFEKLQPKAVTPGEKVDELFMAWDSEATPGAAVAVVKDGKIVYKKGYGMANLEYDIPITPASVFHIASVSKQFTVFSVLLLEYEGKLSLDDDIRKYIPEVPDFGHKLTLRHLATHTSGLRDQWNLLAMAGWRLDDVITKEHVLKLVSKQQDLNFEPGEEYVYSNTGFTLLAEVVSRVSGKSFAEFTEENIFEPLNMESTLFYDDHQKIVKNRAYSYYQDPTGYKKSVLNYANVGATSLFTTVEDLSLWAMNFSNPKVGNTEIIDKMNTPAVLNNGKTFGGALGQFVGEYKGLNEIQHGGADAGYRSYLTRFPDHNTAVIVFSNDASFSSGTLAHQVADIYLENSIEPVEEKEPVFNEVAGEIVKVEQQVLDTYVGDYELMPGFILKVTTKDGKLFAKPTGQEARQLNAISQDEYLVDGVEAKFKFFNVDNKVDKITLEQGGQITEGKRIKAFDESEVVLQDFTGSFYSDELSTAYMFVVEDGKLIAKHSRLEDINLTPTKENSFAGDAWFFGTIDFIRNQENTITGIKVSSGRVRDVIFQKVQ